MAFVWWHDDLLPSTSHTGHGLNPATYSCVDVRQSLLHSIQHESYRHPGLDGVDQVRSQVCRSCTLCLQGRLMSVWYSSSSWPHRQYREDITVTFIMSAMASQITGVSIVCLVVCSGTDQRKHQSSASLAFVRGIHWWPVDSPNKGPVTRKCFYLMTSSWKEWHQSFEVLHIAKRRGLQIGEDIQVTPQRTFGFHAQVLWKIPITSQLGPYIASAPWRLKSSAIRRFNDRFQS